MEYKTVTDTSDNNTYLASIVEADNIEESVEDMTAAETAPDCSENVTLRNSRKDPKVKL